MDLPPADSLPSDHQRRCIARMLRMDKFDIIQNLLAWKIHFAFPDALPYHRSVNSNDIAVAGLDVFAGFRLYDTFNNDQRDCLASLADVPFQAVGRWIRESGTSPARLQAPLRDIADHPPATEQSELAGSLNPYASSQLTTNPPASSKVRVEKGYFTPDCRVCFKRGYDPRSEKRLRSHLRTAEHTLEYKLDSTSNNGSELYHCGDKVFDDKELWVSHVVRFHCHSTDISSASPQGVSTPGSSSGRYAGESCYQRTPSSGVTRSTSVSGIKSRRCSDMSGLYGGGPPQPSKFPVSFEDAPTPKSKPRFHLEPPYHPQTVTSTSLPNGQFPLATDGFGDFLFDGYQNEIFRAHDGSLVSDGYAGQTPDIIGQQIFAYNDSGANHNYWYPMNI